MLHLSYKLICLDMDGTLLDDEKKVSERNVKAIRDAISKGIKVAICTGRIFTSANYYADIIGSKLPIIATNGAYIREKDEDRIIYKHPIDVEKCKEILDVSKKYGLYPHFNTPDVILTEKIIYSSKAYLEFNKNLPKDKQLNIEIVSDWQKTLKKYEDEVMKCIIANDDLDKIHFVKELLAKDKELEVVSSARNNIEIMSAGVSKGRAVEVLAGFYGIDRQDIICIGDNENDISMLQYAGMGVAMGNGEECAKNAAKYITDTNNNDGVAKVIEEYVL